MSIQLPCQTKGLHTHSFKNDELFNISQFPSTTKCNCCKYLANSQICTSGNGNWSRKRNKREAQHYWKVILFVWENFALLLMRASNTIFPILWSCVQLGNGQWKTLKSWSWTWSPFLRRTQSKKFWEVFPCGLKAVTGALKGTELVPICLCVL